MIVKFKMSLEDQITLAIAEGIVKGYDFSVIKISNGERVQVTIRAAFIPT